MAKARAQSHYLKGKTESFQKKMDDAGIWRDVEPIVTTFAEEKSIEPKLRQLEAQVPRIENRRMLLEADADLTKLPYGRLNPQRQERYGKIETQLNDLAQIITGIEQETAVLGTSPFASREESKELASRVSVAQARELGITRSGGVEVGTSRVAYRSGAPAKTWTIFEYPTGNLDERTGAYTSIFKVYDREGRQVGEWNHKPSAAEIKTKWRS